MVLALADRRPWPWSWRSPTGGRGHGPGARRLRKLVDSLMAILRHSRIGLTMDIYTQVPDKTTKEALKRLSDWLDMPGDRGLSG
jgi:hypothetical protein